MQPIILGQELLLEFLNGIKGDLIAYMQSENRNASGKSVASLQVITNPASGQLIGGSWIEYTFRGRPPGKMPPLSDIIDWCNAKGLPRGIAWVVAKRIAESGTKLYQQGRNILNEIITEARVQEFIDKLIVYYTAQIKSDIDTLIAA